MADQSDITAAVDSYMGEATARQGAQARFAMANAVGTNPTYEAELRNVAKRTGVPVDTVRAYPDELKKQATLGAYDFDGMAAQFPNATKFLSDQDNALVGHQEVGLFTSLESAVRSLVDPRRGAPAKGAGDAGVLTNAQFSARIKQIRDSNPALDWEAARALAGQGVTLDNTSVGMTESQRPEPTALNLLTGLGSGFKESFIKADHGLTWVAADLLGLDGVAANAKRLSDQSDARVFLSVPQPDGLGGMVYNGVQSTVQQLPGIGASIATGNPVPALASIFGITAAGSYGKYRDRGGSVGQALLGSGLEGGLEVATEYLPMRFLTDKIGKMGAGEFAKGFFGKELVGEEVNTILSHAVDTAIANPDKTWGQYFAELPGAMVETAVQTLVQSGLLAGASHGLEKTVMRAQAAEYRARLAEQHAQVFTDMQATMAASDILKHSPESLRSYAQDLADEGVPTVFVDSAKLVEAGVDLQALAQAMPSVAAQLAQAETGGDLAIPTGELLTNSIGTAFAQPLIDHARTDVNGMSREEAKAYMDQKGDALNAEIEKVMAAKENDAEFKAGRDQVQAQILTQLNDIKRFTPKVNEQYATLAANFYAVMAARSGMAVQDFADKYKLGFDANTAQGSTVMDQAVTPEDVSEVADEIAAKHGLHELRLSLNASGDISLDMIAAANKGQGAGTAAMQDLVAYADKVGRRVVLSPAQKGDPNGTSSRSRLVKFYKRFGFTENKGRSKDFTVSEAMIRERNTLSQSQIEDPKVGVSNVLLTLGQNDDLYQYPRSDALDVRDIAADKSWVNDKGEVATVQVSDVDKNSDNNKLWMLANTTPDDDVAAGTKSWILTLPTGKHATLTQKNGEVYVNVSGVGEGNGGSAVYDLAANYALNNGLVFVGDPNGVSPAAMRRRLENMLSSAIKYGTTDHLKPHPDQYLGDASIGVPPLDWTNGDTLANIRSMVDVSIASTEYSNPEGSTLVYNPATADFQNGSTGARIGSDEIAELAAGDQRTQGAGQGGVRTLQRTALFKSLVQSEGARRAFLESVRGQQDSGSQNPSGALAGTFYQGDVKPGFDQTQTEAFKRWSNDAPLIDSASAETHEFKTGQKVALEAYHGTARPDRVGTVFQKKRATSGPMAFFTSNPELASSYAKGKADTSLANEDQDYANWFKFKPEGSRSSVDLVRAWYALTPEQKTKISELAPRVTYGEDQNEDGSNAIVLGDEGHTNGTGSYDYNLQQTQRGYDKRGNPLKALVEDWLNSGNLFNDEEQFMKVLQLAGFPVKDITYDSPHSAFPFVYKTYIEMQNPLVTSDVPQAVVDALKAAAKKDRSRAASGGADMWDKNTRTLKEWVANYTDPANASAAFVWTSIPDKVTDIFKAMGYDGIVDWSGKGGGAIVSPVYIPFAETQVKSALGNKGKFDGSKKDILKQDARGQIAFGNDITQQASLMSLLQNADLSTFIHESGHFFLEVQTDLANRIAARAAQGEVISEGERSIMDDMNKTLAWMGVKATPEMSALDHWAYLTPDEKRPYHEQWARGFEAYAFEGKAPSLDLQHAFQTFRAWLVNVYRALLKSVNASKTDVAGAMKVELSDEVRSVMDRMLATSDQIAEAEAARDMGPLFKTAEQAGMTLDEFKAYHDQGTQATMDAVDALQARGLRDMQWLNNARSRKLKELQKQHDALRAQIVREVRAEVMSQPIYRAWTFLTSRAVDKVVGEKPAGNAKGLNPEVDNLFTAIAKLGGLDRAEVLKLWGIDEKEKLESGVFGAPVVRKTGGLSTDAMAERLMEAGYLLPDEHGKADAAKFEELFDDQRRGTDRYSIQRDMAAAYGDAPLNVPELPEVGFGKLRTEELRRRYGTADDAVWRKLSELRMTSDEGGLDPDVVGELFGFSSGDELVKTLAATEPPKSVIEGMTDTRMLQEHGDLATPAGLERAADAAIHNDARARFVATELKALQKAMSVREKVPGQKNTVDVLARAARDYATAIIAKLRVRDIRPGQYAAAEARSAKAAAKAVGDIAQATMHKRNQLINLYATKAAYAAQEEIKKIDLFFKQVVSGRGDAAKTRDMDIVMATRAVLANYGYGAKAKNAAEYLKSVESYDPGLHAVLMQSVSVAEAHAMPLKDMTYEALKGLHAEIESMWFLAKRTRSMEIDGNLMDQQDVADKLVERMHELGIPDSMPGDTSAVTPAEQRSLYLAQAGAAMRRVESWVDRKDGFNKIGAFRRYVFTPIKEAADRYRADKLVHLRAFRNAFATIAPTMQRGLIHAPELNYTFGKDSGGVAMNEILHAILHTGNESNMRKLLLGRNWATEDANGNLDTRRWDAFIHRLVREGKITKDHYDFAQKVWDGLEAMKPLAQKAHREAYGKYFDEVQAQGFTTPFGSYRGGYVPAMADSRIVKDNELKKLIEEGKEGMAYAFPGTSKGFTKARVEYNKPLMLDMRTLPQHIDKVLLFSHMEVPVRDMAKLLASKSVSIPLGKLDPAANQMLTPWLNRAARQQVTTPVAGAGGMMRVLNTLRNRTGMAYMFGNLSNAVQQVSGFMTAGVKVKPSSLAVATAQYLKSPKKMAEAVAALSPYMANRMGNEVGAMMSEIEGILLNPSVLEKAQEFTKKHAYFLQSAVDNVMGPIIWTGAYNDALAENYDLTDAARIADAAIRQTQGSTLPEDVSRIETGPAYARIFTQFYGYFNMQANLLGTEFGKVSQEMGLRKGMGRGFYVMLAGFYGTAVVAELVAQLFKGGPGDDDKDGEWLDDWLMAVLVYGPMRNATAFVPFVGGAVNSAVARFNGNPNDDKMSLSPVVGAVEAGAGVPFDLYKAAIGEGNAQRTVKDVATLISVTVGLPANLAARPVSYVAGIAQGKVEPTSNADAVRGGITGTASPDSRVR